MHSLATGPWKKKNEAANRITWCVDTIREYFVEKLVQLLEKDLRRLGHGNPTIVDQTMLPGSQEQIVLITREFIGKQLSLLDVGSCYNPFMGYKEFRVTAIDIAPATEVRMRCTETSKY